MNIIKETIKECPFTDGSERILSAKSKSSVVDGHKVLELDVILHNNFYGNISIHSSYNKYGEGKLLLRYEIVK